jgi:haloacetate dehalogenase
MGSRSAGLKPFTDEAFAEYVRCLPPAGCARGVCEDYRASASIDLEHDRADIEAGHHLKLAVAGAVGRRRHGRQMLRPAQGMAASRDRCTRQGTARRTLSGRRSPERVLAEALAFLR